jgi:hypothetical protein
MPVVAAADELNAHLLVVTFGNLRAKFGAYQDMVIIFRKGGFAYECFVAKGCEIVYKGLMVRLQFIGRDRLGCGLRLGLGVAAGGEAGDQKERKE